MEAAVVRAAALVATVLLMSSAASAQTTDFNQAFADWKAVVAGTVQMNSLPPQRQQGVLWVATQLSLAKSRNAPEGASDECRTALHRAEDDRSELESKAERLRSCAAGSDLRSEDCSSEAKAAKSSQSDLEDDVSHVRSLCRE